jgi:hypothetical protein
LPSDVSEYVLSDAGNEPALPKETVGLVRLPEEELLISKLYF